jgi:hypothetical protein
MRGGVVAWRCVEVAAGLLPAHDREALLGDLAETDRGALPGLFDVLGLALRRQLLLWRSWRPWAASIALAWPASLFLMGCSVWASGRVARLMGQPLSPASMLQSFSSLFLILCWAWMAGFAVSAVSRRTLWASALGCGAPCLFCLSEWPGSGLSCLQLLIFLLPAVWGAWRARRCASLGPDSATFLAAVAMLTPLMWNEGGWLYGGWLLWPAWYLAATARYKQV